MFSRIGVAPGGRLIAAAAAVRTAWLAYADPRQHQQVQVVRDLAHFRQCVGATRRFRRGHFTPPPPALCASSWWRSFFLSWICIPQTQQERASRASCCSRVSPGRLTLGYGLRSLAHFDTRDLIKRRYCASDAHDYTRRVSRSERWCPASVGSEAGHRPAIRDQEPTGMAPWRGHFGWFAAFLK